MSAPGRIVRLLESDLGGASDIVGLKVLVNSHPMTVIGVAAAGFRGIDWAEVPALWIPTMMKRQATPRGWQCATLGFQGVGSAALGSQ